MNTDMFRDAEEKEEHASRTVTLSSQDIQAVVRILSRFTRQKPSALEQQLLRQRSIRLVQDSAREHPVKWNALIQVAQEEYRRRRSRSRVFDDAMFGEPAWDMLLALFINGRSGEKLTVSRLLRFSGSSASAALRWLNYLEKKGHIHRESKPTEARSTIVMLYECAERAIETYLSEILKSQT